MQRDMNFKEKLETAVRPLVLELGRELRALKTLDVLNCYQLRIDFVQTDKNKVPDGFIFKWRYLWAQLLSQPYQDVGDMSKQSINRLDDLIERIFETYKAGALYEPGRIRGSEKEFLTRLGLAIRVREPEVLAFPEQIRDWSMARLQPFDNSYFVPRFGVRFAEIVEWVGSLIGKSETKLNASVLDLGTIVRDMECIRGRVLRGELDDKGAQNEALGLGLKNRLGANALEAESVHVFSPDELQCGISGSAAATLTSFFSIVPGEVEAGLFPHDSSPLGSKMFVALPANKFYFLDPANAYQIVAKTFENELLGDSRIRDTYLRNRDLETERWVTRRLQKVFSGADVYPNYYLKKGEGEKDAFVRYGGTAILVECKNTKVRAFRGGGADLFNFQRDFKNSIQFGYEQALAVKQRILGSEEVTFLDRKGRPYFSVRRGEITRYYIVCVTITPRGLFGTDLSYELTKPADEPYPLALNLFDFDTICKHLNKPERFLAYLDARERMHGRVHTGDEMNFAGYFFKYGNLEIQDGTMLADDFSGVFDRAWFREKGVEAAEPDEPPATMTITRHGNRVTVEHPTGQKETLKVPAQWIERASGRPPIRMRGSDRNMLCPCGSGRKLKYCCGIA